MAGVGFVLVAPVAFSLVVVLRGVAAADCDAVAAVAAGCFCSCGATAACVCKAAAPEADVVSASPELAFSIVLTGSVTCGVALLT